MLGNAQQLLAIATAAYPDFQKVRPDSQHCAKPASEAEEVACLWVEAMEYHKKWTLGGPVSEDDVVFLFSKVTYAACEILPLLTVGSFHIDASLSCLVLRAIMICGSWQQVSL